MRRPSTATAPEMLFVILFERRRRRRIIIRVVRVIRVVVECKLVDDGRLSLVVIVVAAFDDAVDDLVGFLVVIFRLLVGRRRR